MLAVPGWFISDCNATARWGMNIRAPNIVNSGDLIALSTLWWDVQHPHVVRFMGACHVSDPPAYIHESTRPLSDYVQ